MPGPAIPVKALTTAIHAGYARHGSRTTSLPLSFASQEACEARHFSPTLPIQLARAIMQTGRGTARTVQPMARPVATAVYLMADLASGDVKIGISTRPDIRAKQVAATYQVGEIYIAGICWFRSKREAIRHEREFHRIYKSRRTQERGGREWFCLSRTEIESFLEGMRLYQEEVQSQRGRYRNKGTGRKESVLPQSRYRNLGVGQREDVRR